MNASHGLRVTDLSVRFSGLVALQSVDIEAPRGRLTGLIGPNGAGKTTLFNACTGLTHAASGKVHLDGHDLVGRSPAQRARLGLGRTFQRMQLCDALSVAENVAMGREAALAGARVLGQLHARRAERVEVAEATATAMELCGLLPQASRPAGTLSTGQRRLVELARALAGPFTTLLLDEPSSGLDVAETARFGEILHHVMATRSVGIVLVEHDMELVMNVCEQVYVLDFGKVIFEGTADETRGSDVVRAAYLGDGTVG
jgi:ABC-type branched-subunit amino acid transport system ATPase component